MASPLDDVVKDLVLTATAITVAIDRGDWQTVLDRAKSLEEHGMQLASFATRELVKMPMARKGLRINLDELLVTPARCPADSGGGTDSQRCVHLAGHAGTHIDAEGHRWLP